MQEIEQLIDELAEFRAELREQKIPLDRARVMVSAYNVTVRAMGIFAKRVSSEEELVICPEIVNCQCDQSECSHAKPHRKTAVCDTNPFTGPCPACKPLSKFPAEDSYE